MHVGQDHLQLRGQPRKLNCAHVMINIAAESCLTSMHIDACIMGELGQIIMHLPHTFLFQ